MNDGTCQEAVGQASEALSLDCIRSSTDTPTRSTLDSVRRRFDPPHPFVVHLQSGSTPFLAQPSASPRACISIFTLELHVTLRVTYHHPCNITD